jgi:hypothetical protein
VKIDELLTEGIRYRRPVPVREPVTIEVPPNTPGAFRETKWNAKTWSLEPTGRWIKIVKRTVKRDGETVTHIPFRHDAKFRVAANDWGEPTPAGKAGEGFILGPVGDWLDKMGATKEDIPAALKLVRQSNEYKKLIDLGFQEKPTPARERDGTLVLVASFKPNLNSPEPMNLFYRVLPNGKIRALPSESSRHGGPVQTFQPMTTETHPNLTPVERIAGSMIRSLAKLRKVVARHVKTHLFKQNEPR